MFAIVFDPMLLSVIFAIVGGIWGFFSAGKTLAASSSSALSPGRTLGLVFQAAVGLIGGYICLLFGGAILAAAAFGNSLEGAMAFVILAEGAGMFLCFWGGRSAVRLVRLAHAAHTYSA